MIRMRMLGLSLLVLQGIAVAATPGVADANMVDQTRTIRQVLQEEQIRTLASEPNQVGGELSALDTLIEDLNRLQVAAAPAPEPQPVQEELPAEEPVAQAAPETPGTADAAPEAPAEPVPVTGPADVPAEQWESVASVANPLEVADALYQGGTWQQARRFYRQYVDARQAPEDPDYQWALYQVGVCELRDNPSEAAAFFGRLIEGSPNSPWAGAAKARLTTLTWETTVNLTKIAEIPSDPNSL